MIALIVIKTAAMIARLRLVRRKENKLWNKNGDKMMFCCIRRVDLDRLINTSPEDSRAAWGKAVERMN